MVVALLPDAADRRELDVAVGFESKAAPLLKGEGKNSRLLFALAFAHIREWSFFTYRADDSLAAGCVLSLERSVDSAPFRLTAASSVSTAIADVAQRWNESQ